jgi:hypothetical protein
METPEYYATIVGTPQGMRWRRLVEDGVSG